MIKMKSTVSASLPHQPHILSLWLKLIMSHSWVQNEQKKAGVETVELGTYLQGLKGSGNMDEEGCQDSDKAIFPYQNGHE